MEDTMTYRTSLPAILILAGLAAPAIAGGESYYDYAKVVESHPVYETVRVVSPRQVCRDEPMVETASRRNSYTSVITGGIIGGVLGNQLVHGKYRDWGTIGGALLGGTLGNDYYQRYQAPRTGGGIVRRCHEVETVREQRQVTGYRVAYRYQGHEYWTTMDHDPGKRVRVAVTVDVAE
jgi:uncharacterized protein YcfJ